MKKLLIPLLGILVAGCVINNTQSTGEQAQEYLELWMSKNYPGVTPEASGIYIVSDQQTGGALWQPDNLWVYTEITIRSLDGTINSTDNEDLAKQLGTYQVSGYYGPKFSCTGEGVSYAGFDLMMEGMHIGGTRTAVIPAWLLTTSRYMTQKEYMDNCTASKSLIYTVKFMEQATEPAEIEKMQVAAYISSKFPGATATVMPGSEEGATADGTFWFISDVSGFKEEDKRAEDETGLSLNYTGSRLDGTVFDTSVQKVAIDNDIYSDSRSYEPLPITYSTAWDSISISGSTSYVDGFKAAVYLMQWSGQKATVVFTSDHGYTSSSQGVSIPAYCPLVFELELVPKEE